MYIYPGFCIKATKTFTHAISENTYKEGMLYVVNKENEKDFNDYMNIGDDFFEEHFAIMCDMTLIAEHLLLPA